jgi:hypothetical protein
MKKWIRKYFYRLLTATMICFTLVYLISGVIHRELTGVQIACVVVFLLAMGVSAVNNRKNKTLHEATLCLFFAALAVARWTEGRTFLAKMSFVCWVLASLLCGLSAVGAYFESKKSGCDTDRPCENVQ